MAQSRSEVVNRLVEAATNGMLEGPRDSTADEVFSAYMTMTLRAVMCAKDLGADMQPFRVALERIWRELPPSHEVVN